MRRGSGPCASPDSLLCVRDRPPPLHLHSCRGATIPRACVAGWCMQNENVCLTADPIDPKARRNFVFITLGGPGRGVDAKAQAAWLAKVEHAGRTVPADRRSTTVRDLWERHVGARWDLLHDAPTASLSIALLPDPASMLTTPTADEHPTDGLLVAQLLFFVRCTNPAKEHPLGGEMFAVVRWLIETVPPREWAVKLDEGPRLDGDQDVVLTARTFRFAVDPRRTDGYDRRDVVPVSWICGRAFVASPLPASGQRPRDLRPARRS